MTSEARKKELGASIREAWAKTAQAKLEARMLYAEALKDCTPEELDAELERRGFDPKQIKGGR